MKGFLARKKAAAIVTAASRRWAASTTETLEERLRPELAEGETMPDLELAQRLLGRALDRQWRRLESTDEAQLAAAARRGRRSAGVAEALVALYRRVVDLRRLMTAVVGAVRARRLLGLAGKTSVDPVVLLRQAGQAVARLRDAALVPAPAAYQPSARDRQRWAKPVEAAARVLESARASASIGGKELEAAVAARRRALADFNAAFVELAGWLEAIYRAARRAERAAAVRPSRRRPGVLLEDDDRHRGRSKTSGTESTSEAEGPRPSSPRGTVAAVDRVADVRIRRSA
ncbi:MAG: hypothetical protein GY719_22575 [bacterium]|nr:hypothetical protein [bacterium]